jgi:hypothetical protein
LPVATETLDPVRDPISGEAYFQTSDSDQTVNLSRLGIRLSAECAPAVGTRLLIRLEPPGEVGPIDLIGRTRWARVELRQGSHDRRAVCGVGIELLGGSRRALDRYERLLADLATDGRSVAGDPTLG